MAKLFNSQETIGEYCSQHTIFHFCLFINIYKMVEFVCLRVRSVTDPILTNKCTLSRKWNAFIKHNMENLIQVYYRNIALAQSKSNSLLKSFQRNAELIFLSTYFFIEIIPKMFLKLLTREFGINHYGKRCDTEKNSKNKKYSGNSCFLFFVSECIADH